MNEEKKIKLAFLPRLKTNFSITGKLGEWSSNREMLSDLPDNLDIGKNTSATAEALTAIPTIWARPLLFRSALFNDDHPLHDEVTNEWRGLLGLFALQQFFNLEVKFEGKIALNENSKPFLAKVLYNLIEGDSWSRLNLVKLDGKLIACTSPSTFFFTPPNFPETKIGWQNDNGKLYDPVKFLKERKNENLLSLLKGWLFVVRKELKVSVKEESGFRNKFGDIGHLSDILEKWENSIEEVPQIPGVDIAFSDEGSFYKIPSSSIKTEGILPQRKSDFLLKAERKLATIPIVIWPEQWDNPEKTVRGAFTPDKVAVPNESHGQELENGRIKAFWIRPEKYFFTDRILKLGINKDNTLNSNKNGYIPPLKPEILNYFSPESIGKYLKWIDKGKKGLIEVELSLPLSDGRMAKFRKTYDKKSIIEGSGDPPILALWPNFYAPNWSNYYMFFEMRKKYEKFDFEPVYGVNKQIGKGTKTVFRKEIENQLKCMPACPEAIQCSYAKETVGLALIKWQKTVENIEGEIKIAVDFGTSNCTIAKRVGEDVGSLDLNSRTLLLTSVPREALLRMTRLFFSSDKVEQIFPTIFRRLKKAPVHPEAIIDGVILFEHPETMVISYGSFIKEIVENIKWSAQPEERKYLSLFMQQLLLMIAAEARSENYEKVLIQWSYPTAFSDHLRDELTGCWNQLSIDIGKEVGIKFSNEPTTESVAVCHYIMKYKKAKAGSERPQVVIDIGGGTTDVGIWKKNKLESQSSFRLAGNNIASIFVENEIYFKKLREIADLEQIGINESYTHFNLILKYASEKIFKALYTGDSRSAEIIQVRSAILFTFNSIFFYIGTILRSISTAKDVICDVYLAGNGSSYLKWVVNTEGGLSSILIESIRDGYNAKAGNDISIQYSKNPKTEVAYGLLVKSQDISNDTAPVAILGESGYSLKGKKLSELENLYDLFQNDITSFGLVDVPSEFDQLKQLIELNDKCAGRLNLLSAKGRFSYNKIGAHVQHCLNKNSNDQYKNVFIEPFFILEAVAVLEEAFVNIK